MAAVIAIAVIEIKMYGTIFKGIYKLFLDITGVFINVLVMSKKHIYIPLKVVPYIFISITAIAITAATYVIT